jgi:hypothetical protein
VPSAAGDQKIERRKQRGALSRRHYCSQAHVRMEYAHRGLASSRATITGRPAA